MRGDEDEDDDDERDSPGLAKMIEVHNPREKDPIAS